MREFKGGDLASQRADSHADYITVANDPSTGSKSDEQKARGRLNRSLRAALSRSCIRPVVSDNARFASQPRTCVSLSFYLLIFTHICVLCMHTPVANARWKFSMEMLG